MNWEKEVPCFSNNYDNDGLLDSVSPIEGLVSLLKEMPEVKETFCVVINHLTDTRLLRLPGLFIYVPTTLTIGNRYTYTVQYDLPNRKVENIKIPGVSLTGNENDASLITIYPDHEYIELLLNDKHFGVINLTRKQIFTVDFTHYETSKKKHIKIMKAILDLVNTKYPQLKSDNRDYQADPVKVTIGCDPELEPISENGYVCSAKEISGLNLEGAIGKDGSGNQVELRPSPGKPEHVVKNLNELILKACNEEHKIKDLSVEGDVFPLGFHIHFGVENDSCLSEHKTLLLLLDRWLMDRFDSCHGRARGSYKEHSSYRRASHGGWEYRSLPGRVLSNPVLTSAVLKTAYWIADRFYNLKPIPINPYVFIDLRKAYKIVGLTDEEIDALLNVHKIPSNYIKAAWEIKKEDI